MIFEDFSSAQSTVLWAVFATAFIMGAVVNKTNFCTMGAVSDWVNMGDKSRFRAWLLAICVAVIGVVVLESNGIASMDKTLPPYRGSNFAWLEYILGGIIFGIGMTYGSGCANKTLVRLGGGNLKSIVVFAVISVTAYFMLNPFPGTDQTLYSELFYGWTSKLSVSLSTPQDLGSLLAANVGGDVATMRMIAGLVLAAALLVYILKSADFRRSFDNILGGLVVGLSVLAVWYITAALVTISADGDMLSWTDYASVDSWDMLEDNADARPRDVGVQSFTFINPIGQILRLILHSFDNAYVTFGVMAVLGVIAGSFIWSVISRSFRLEWFANFKDFLNHFIGAFLMGVGGVLGLGCTIGQGVTGISTLALGSFFTFTGIIFGSALTMKIQYYKLVYEDEASLIKAFLSALVDMKLLPASMRKLDAI